MNLYTRIFLLLVFLPALVFGEENTTYKQGAAPSAVESLSGDLRNLLSKEILALQNGMMSIFPAYVSGSWGEIEGSARQMKNSYLLGQNLSKAQGRELHFSLPHEFVKTDQKFHYLAGMIEHAAKIKNQN